MGVLPGVAGASFVPVGWAVGMEQAVSEVGWAAQHSMSVSCELR